MEVDRLQRFISTPETRCVRDIKRIFSWKIYGVSYSKECNTRAHYVRVSFADRENDKSFSDTATLLDSISAKRHVILPEIRPFGVGVDQGVPASHNRIYLINNCAKLTPYLRKVTVDFEVNVEGTWQRFDANVDRIGFATYRSAPTQHILTSPGPEDVHFVDDPYVRFGRMTLRFGDRQERTYIDLEGGEKSIPHISRTRKGTVVYLPKVRVRTSEGRSRTVGRTPVRTMARLIFREKDAGFLSYARNAATEAEKFATLIRKTSRLVTGNCLGIRHCIDDVDIVPLPLTAVTSLKSYVIKLPGNPRSHRADISDKFCQNAHMFAVPTHRTSSRGGIALITQSGDGEFVIRQHIENPVEFIASVTSRGFTVSYPSSLITTKTGTRVPAAGALRYSFSIGEKDAAIVVDKLIKLVISIDAQQDLPSRLPLLKTLMEQRKRSGYTPGHSRSASEASACSDMSDASVDSVDSFAFAAKSSRPEREPSDWDILEQLTTDDVFGEDNEDQLEIEIGLDRVLEQLQREQLEHLQKQQNQPQEAHKHAFELEQQLIEGFTEDAWDAGMVVRATANYTCSLEREVGLKMGEPVYVQYRNRCWCFVKTRDGQTGWAPSAFLGLDMVEPWRN